MVRVVELIAFSNLAFGAIASCHRYAVSLQPFDLAGCDGHDLHDKLTLKEGQCRDSHIHDPFFSFNLGPYEPGKKGHDLNAIPYPCKVWWYDAPDCKGSSGHTDDLHKAGEFDKCHSTGFTQNGTLPHGARAVRLHCEKPKKSKSQSHMAPAATVADFVYTTTIHTKIPVLISSSTSGTVQSSTVCKNITKTETVTWKPSSTVVSGSTKSVITASVKKTTTIIAPPTATVEGTTTVWVAPTSSSKSTRTQTWVATITDAAHPDAVKRAVHEASLAHEAAQPAKSPASVIHPSSDSVECYVSQDGHWLISTCSATTAAPARTSSATKSTKATKSSTSKSRAMTRTATFTPTRTSTRISKPDDISGDISIEIDCSEGDCDIDIDEEYDMTPIKTPGLAPTKVARNAAAAITNDAEIDDSTDGTLVRRGHSFPRLACKNGLCRACHEHKCREAQECSSGPYIAGTMVDDWMTPVMANKDVQRHSFPDLGCNHGLCVAQHHGKIVYVQACASGPEITGTKVHAAPFEPTSFIVRSA